MKRQGGVIFRMLLGTLFVILATGLLAGSIWMVYRFLKTVQSDGYDLNQKFALSANGLGSVPIPNIQNWLMELIEREYLANPFPLDKLLPVDVQLPKRRPTFANFLGYNTLLFLRDGLHVQSFVPQMLCQFICDYLTACCDNVSKQDLSYKKTYDMLQNCKKTYKSYPIPISWVKN